MKTLSIPLLFGVLLATGPVAAQEDISKVNGSISADAGQRYGKLDTVNGGIRVGEGVETGRHAATIAGGSTGVFHGMKSLFLQDDEGQITPVYSISAGLDYPGVGPEHAHLHTSGRAEYYPITDEEAVTAFEYLSRMEGIIPAIESAHAVALLRKMKDEFKPDEMVCVTISGRGDKDVEAIGRYRGQLV